MSEERTRDLPDSRSFEERLFARFDRMETRFDRMETRFDEMETRFDEMETRFEARFQTVDVRFDAVDARLDGLDHRVQALEAKALDTKPIWERALAEIVGVKQVVEEVKQSLAEVKGRVENIERKFELLIIDMMQLRGDQRRVEKRMDAVESPAQ
jgi:chromosome segregation ATPase